MKEAALETGRSRASLRRGGPASISKVNLTAYPCGYDPTTDKPIKLSNVAPVNHVFMKTALYHEIIDGPSDSLFPYPTWKEGASYDIATSHGARVDVHHLRIIE